MDLLDLLRGEQELTTDAIAERLGVSVRTVRRDLALLRERGHPISGEAGRGGGVRLERDRGVAAVHLSLDEIVALWLAASLARVGSSLPWSDATQRAVERLLASLPRERGRELRALLRRVIVGPPATPSVVASAGVTPREVLAVFEDAFRARVSMTFAYRDRHGNASHRLVEPHGILVQPPVWYVLGVDRATQARRSFRMDRIAKPAASRTHPFIPSRAVIEAFAAEVAEAYGHR